MSTSELLTFKNVINSEVEKAYWAGHKAGRESALRDIEKKLGVNKKEDLSPERVIARAALSKPLSAGRKAAMTRKFKKAGGDMNWWAKASPEQRANLVKNMAKSKS